MLPAPPSRRLEEVEVSAQNRRFLVRLDDGSAVETVLYRGDTLCLSTQVGCAVGCPFCASGAQGLGRALTLEELVLQLEEVRRAGHAPTKLTLSGIGEPLHVPATEPFLDWARRGGLRVSLTTSGGPLHRLRAWLHRPHNGLTLSVHAGTEALRARLVPKGPALGPLFAVLAEELPRLTATRRKKTALAYLVLRDASDAPMELDAFAARARPLGLAVHLYAHNPVATSPFEGVSREVYEAAYARLRAAGLVVRMSSTARREANGGCGTLVPLRRSV
ncbi:MAG: radical SAM protein [Myxococcota bacterium]